MSAKKHYNDVASGIPPEVLRVQREAHNSLKDCCIRDSIFFSGTLPSSPLTVLDLACGRGGDLPKLRSHTVNYHGVDVADKALEEAERRFHEMGMQGSVHTYCSDAADVELPSTLAADVAIMNFALHYFTDSHEHCDKLFAKVSSALRPGGVFCGVCPIAEKVPQSMHTTALHWPTRGEMIAMPWGHQYRYVMPPFVDAHEYLVPMKDVIEVAHRHRLYLMKTRGAVEYAREKGICAEAMDPMFEIFMFIRV